MKNTGEEQVIMKKVKYGLFAVGLMMMSVSITGCGIKFIEKVEPTSTVSESTEQFGDITIEPTPEPTSEPTEESSEETTTSSEVKPTEEPMPEGMFEYDGVRFIRNDSKPTLYVLEDCPAKVSPNMSSKDYTFLYKGDFVTLSALSEDEKWAMVSIYGGPSSFVEYSCLTYEEVVVSSQVSELPSESESTESTETTTETTDSESNVVSSTATSSQQESSSSSETRPSESSSSSSETYEEPSQEEPVDDYEGISFPSNASYTSFNMGVEFADVNITLYVRRGGAVISNGPDRPSNSTGYYIMGELLEGSSVRCTGIGRNGFVRVDYDGETGFIDSKSVEY